MKFFNKLLKTTQKGNLEQQKVGKCYLKNIYLYKIGRSKPIRRNKAYRNEESYHSFSYTDKT